MENIEITQIEYAKTINLGNYESAKIGLTASVNADQDWTEVLAALRQLVKEHAAREKANQPVAKR